MATRTTNWNITPNAKNDTTFFGFNVTLPSEAKFDLTDAAIKMDVRKTQIGSIQTSFELTKTGTYTFKFPEQVITLESGTYEYDILISYTDREVRYISGQWIVEPTITEK